MQDAGPGNVQKKASSEILFADYGKNPTANEDPTQENKRVIDLYDPVDAMSLNRERDRVVVSGIRGVLQIIKIQTSKNDIVEKPSIVKDLDMRVYRKGKVNILYSAQNVKWNQLYDQYIATTSSNGSIVCWNVSRKNKSVFKSHERSATCLDWHATAPYILVSGSRDCSVKSYDMRVKDGHQLTFTDRNCESIRDVAMCKSPGFDDFFFTGDDGGVLRLWDLRQTKRWIFQKVAHRSFVSTLSINPHQRELIATGGGRDKMVKIWEWTGPSLNRISVVETTAPLGRVVWRPDKQYHLATCASVNETTVHVWDVRRPYLPYVTYDEHRDSVTDACWPTNDYDVFLTCGKDGLVVLHNIDSGHAPISYACDVAFDITPDGTMGLAVNSEIHAKNDAALEASLAPANGKKKKHHILYESFNKPIKSLVAFGVPESLTHSLPPTTFYKIAEKYVIGGAEIMLLCEKNSKIARKAGLEHVAQTWRLVEALCEQARIQEEYDKLTAEEKARVIRAWVVRKRELAEEGRRWLANLNDHFRDDVKKHVTQRLENTQHVTAFLRFSSSSESEDGNENARESENNKDVDRMAPNVNKVATKKKNRKKKKNATATDFYFGEGEANFKGGKEEILHHNEFIGLRDEAYELRDVEKERRFFCKAKKQPTTAEEYEEQQRELLENEAEFQAWSPMLEIYRLLLYHAEQGDMQTCATITMVCGKRLLDAVDFYTINGWITCYMEMLDSLELYTAIAKIRKYCTLESISSVSRENTTIQLAHAACDALIVNGRCTKCETVAQADCTVCRFPIVGMTYQCNVCGHCMHADHAFEWFQNTISCAFVGCPCTCGDNMWPDIERTFIGNDEISKGHRKFEHVEQSEPSSNRVDASRLDSDSEESTVEDPEWTPATADIKEKFGEIPCKDWNTPWAQYLFRLHTERCRSSEEAEEGSNSDATGETLDADRRVLSPITQREIDESFVRGAFVYDIENELEEQKKLIRSAALAGKVAVDGEDYVYRCLDPEDEEEAQTQAVSEQENPSCRRLEQIIEVDEDESENSENSSSQQDSIKVEQIVVRRVAEKQEEDEEFDDEEDSECFSSEDISSDDDDRLYGDDYIKKIPPIGFQKSDIYDYEEEYRSNEKSSSPTLNAAVRDHLTKLHEMTFGRSFEGNNGDETQSEEDEDEDIAIVNKEAIIRAVEGGDRLRKKRMKNSCAEKALNILNMSRVELKMRKAEKAKKRIDLAYNQVYLEPGTYDATEVSSDEFTVSSFSSSSDSSISLNSSARSTSTLPSSSSKSSESVSPGSSASELFVPLSETGTLNINEGYKAESEVAIGESTAHDELLTESGLRLPSPQATGDLYLKQESPPPETVQRFKRFRKVDNEMPFSSDDDLMNLVDRYETLFVRNEGVIPSPQSSIFSSLPVSPAISPSSSRFPSPEYMSRRSSTEESEMEEEEEEEEEVYDESEFEFSEIQREYEETGESGESLPPSRKTSSIASSHASIIDPLPITSYANPIFSRITGKPPRSKPLSINESEYDTEFFSNGNETQSAPGTNAINPIFEYCSSLPTNTISETIPKENSDKTGSMHSTIQAVSYTSAKKSSNGTNHGILKNYASHQALDSIEPSLENGENLISSTEPLFANINGIKNNVIQKQQENSNESSGSELFSSDEEDRPPSRSTLQDGEPFFPMIDDVPTQSSAKRPWENEEHYQNRLAKEKEEAEEEEREEEQKREAEREKVREAARQAVILSKHTPVMRELARRKRKAMMKISSRPKQFPKPIPALKRVEFVDKEYDDAMTVALENLKLDTGYDVCSTTKNEDYEEFIREQEFCYPCQHEIRENKQEKEYIQWLKNLSEENQMFFAKSFDDPCSIFQLSYLDSYTTDLQKAKITASHLIEFIKMFYFIQWNDLLFSENSWMLKEVYEMWQDYQKKRPRVCRTHFKDYQFRFFASSVATKMKQHLLLAEAPSVRRSLLSYDWLHMKPCVNTHDDDSAILDQMLDTVVSQNPSWNFEEKKAANRYWDMFGDVPIHIESSDRLVVPPASDDQLEILDDSNYWTKKMIKNAMYNARNYDIKLTYTKQKKHRDLFYVQDRSKKVLNRQWQMRLDKMINETRHVDFSTSSFRVNPHNKLIYTANKERPWPVCQFDTGDHYVTVQPMVSRRYQELKSHIRRKFTITRGAKAHRVSKHIEITTDELRKLPSFKKFKPKLQRANDLKDGLHKNFKVINMPIAQNQYTIYTIMEEDDEVDLIVRVLEQPRYKSGIDKLDSEEIFFARRLIREESDAKAYARMKEEEYRKRLENTNRHEAAKMKIMNKHWMPEFRKKIGVARRVIEIGRLMVEEDVRKWMAYQYELFFATKVYRKKSLINKRRMIELTSPKWHETIRKMDFDRPGSLLQYADPPPTVKESEPRLPAYNSSSEEENYDNGNLVRNVKPGAKRKKKKLKSKRRSFIQSETHEDLPLDESNSQFEIEEDVDALKDIVDEELEYSDDSSVSTWFDNDTDDIVNRLINADYIEEHMILKERTKGPLGKKLWKVLDERMSPEPLTDEEENSYLNILINKRNEEKKTGDWLELDLKDIGTSDGKRRKELLERENELDSRIREKRESRREEMEQVHLFLKKFAQDNQKTSDSYVWNDELRDAISALHGNELRRVSNRIHKKMKDEYQTKMEEEEIIANIIPADDSGLQYRLINFLLFQKDGESLENTSRQAGECRKKLRPIQRYEMFFGREGAYKLKTIGEDVMTMKNVRASFCYLIRNFGENLQYSADQLKKFIRVWWHNSKETLERFIACCEEHIDTHAEILGHAYVLCNNIENLEIIRESFEDLEIASLLNDMIYVVDEYVEETEVLCCGSSTNIDLKGFSTMDVWDWLDFKYSYPRYHEFEFASEVDAGTISYASSLSDTSRDSNEMVPNKESSSITAESENRTDERTASSPVQSTNDMISLSTTEHDRKRGRNHSIENGCPNQAITTDYAKVYESLKAREAEKRRRHDEEVARRTLARWEEAEREQTWDVEDLERKVHDYLMMGMMSDERYGEQCEDPEFENWKHIIEHPNRFKDVPSMVIYGKKNMATVDVLEMCGLPLSLDNQMFNIEMDECQSASSSVSDASEYVNAIEKSVESEEYEVPTAEIDDDAKSYSSMKHVFKHEHYFQTDLEARRVPSCVVIFSPERFFDDPVDEKFDYKRWRRIIEASECPFSFNKLVMRERLLRRCRDKFQPVIIEQYLAPDEQNYQRILEIFQRCFILVVLDTEMNAWDCRIVSVEDHSKPASDRFSYIRKTMIEDSQERLATWLEVNKIDMEVYASCPVITVFDELLTAKHGAQMSAIFIDEHVRECWLMIRREEGVRALDAMIRMPKAPDSKLDAYKSIFKPIYDAWYTVWSFENSQSNSKTLVVRNVDPVKEYIHKSRMIVNYAHQHYRMKRFDSLMSKDPTEFQMVDRSDVPSASLFDSLDAAVSKFCNEDSPHLDEPSRQHVKDTLIQLATGKIPYFTANYFGGYDYSENVDLNSQDDDDNDDDKMPILRNTDSILPISLDAKSIELDDCEEEYTWLRAMYEESDFHRRRFMAVLMFELAQRAMLKFAPNMADFERAQKRFEHLLTLHGTQRPLLDMMITKVRGTYFMPLDTNVFLYNTKLITFSEMVDSEIHPEEWRDRKVTFEEHRRQTPVNPSTVSKFLGNDPDDSDSGSEIRSNASSSLSSSLESLCSSNSRKSARKALRKLRKEHLAMSIDSERIKADEEFADERRALGPRRWKVRRRIHDLLIHYAQVDRKEVEAKLPPKKIDLLNYINQLILHFCDKAHKSWGVSKMQIKRGRIPPPDRMEPRHIARIMEGKKMYKPLKKYDPKDMQTSGRKWF